MPTHPRSAPLALTLLLAAAISTVLAAPGARAAALCDATTAMTPIGVDTEAGRVLIAVPPIAGDGGDRRRGWIAEIEIGADRATAYPDAGGRSGGSVGPGPVLAVKSCGGSCLQPLRWSAGSWEPLGEPLQVPAITTTSGTYDLAGTPWLVVHGSGEAAGQVRAWAFHLESRDWQLKGGIPVAAAGDLAAVPSPQRKDGVLSGTGLFTASGKPSSWVAGLPGLPPERQGQVMAIGGNAAAYLSSDGVVYLSADRGKTWKRSTWTPWGAGTAGMWRQGTDYWVDLPVGDRRGPLQLAWFDRRTPGEETLYLTRLGPGGSWSTLAQARSEVTTKNDRLAVSHIFAPREGVWLLLSGCVATGGQSALVVRTYEKGALSAPRLVPLREAKR